MDYIDEIIKVIQKIASGDFSVRVNIEGNDENLDSIANGVNMLAEEIQVLFDKHKTYETMLSDKIKDLQTTVDFTSDTEIRMISMMQEIDDLRKQLNMPPKYMK